MPSSGSNTMIVGGTFNSTIINQSKSRGMDILMERVATGAFHNSDELYDTPKCHPHTRIAVLDDIMQWVNQSESAWDDFMLWLFGPAGAGKSAIAKRIAEIAAERDLLIADFFFSRTSPTRGTKDRLIATLGYQLTVSIPDTRSHIEDAIERDPAIFNKNILTQIDTLLIRPLQLTQITPSKKLIIIDGLDECNDSQAQVAILEAISHSFTQHNLPIKFLVVSRPEPHLVTSFNCEEPLRSIHRRLALDDTYRPDDDIRLFFSDKFEHIKRTHPMRSTIPISWPTRETLETLIKKSSGQFIYASTVVNFVKSICHRPSARLDIILGISPPGRINPFAELDALYNHLLSSVDDIQITLHVLSLYVMAPDLASRLHKYMAPELFLSLKPGDIQLALINLSSIITYEESFGLVEILHASLVDFLSDRHRSTAFYIDKARTCTDFVHRILQYVKGPDGIQAGDIALFRETIELFPWIPKGQLRSDILNFDIEAFINASVRWQHFKEYLYSGPVSTIDTLWFWKRLFQDAGLEDSDEKEALDRFNKYLGSCIQIYQSDWRLQLLLTLAIVDITRPGYYPVPCCRLMDILLEMDNHNLHLCDKYALDLRHAYVTPSPGRLIGAIQSRYVDGDKFASAALHCMRFLSKPPQYSKKRHHPPAYYQRGESFELGLTYVEWKDTCSVTLEMLRTILQERANTWPALVQFLSNDGIHPAIQKHLCSDDIWKLDVQIFHFLSRASVCPNWRIISAIRRSLSITHQQSSKSEGDNLSSDEDGEWRATRDLLRRRLDQCCSDVHIDYI